MEKKRLDTGSGDGIIGIWLDRTNRKSGRNENGKGIVSEMSEEILVQHCAPTLAGLKTANMFTYDYCNEEELKEDVRGLNSMFSEKGINVIPFRYMNGKALLYLYRPRDLERDLSDERASKILEEKGYQKESQGRCLAMLARKLREGGEFPHEIGLFLGYPPEDVEGFMRDRREGLKCVGCWKVYGDEEKAKATFEKYEKCKNAYCMLAGRGRKACELAVSKACG